MLNDCNEAFEFHCQRKESSSVVPERQIVTSNDAKIINCPLSDVTSIALLYWCRLSIAPSQYLRLRTIFGGSMEGGGRQILEIFNFHFDKTSSESESDLQDFK